MNTIFTEKRFCDMDLRDNYDAETAAKLEEKSIRKKKTGVCRYG